MALLGKLVGQLWISTMDAHSVLTGADVTGAGGAGSLHSWRWQPGPLKPCTLTQEAVMSSAYLLTAGSVL